MERSHAPRAPQGVTPSSGVARSAGDVGNPALGHYLFGLLGGRALYRQRWETRVVTRRRGVNHAAVARVLAQYLVDHGERSIYDPRVERSLKDRVGRAAAGRMSAETLRWFIGAFAMDEEHASTLWSLFGAVPDAPATARVDRPPNAAPALAPSWGRVRWAHALLEVGRDGAPVRQRVIVVLQATRRGARGYRLPLDRGVGTVEVVRGGRLASCGNFSGEADGAELTFERVLEAGDTVALEYFCHYVAAADSAPEFCWTARRAVTNVELGVQFPRTAERPSVRWMIWERPGGAVLHEEPLALDLDRAAHRFFDRLMPAVVGFRWAL